MVNTGVQCDPIIITSPPSEKIQPKKRLDQTKPTLINIISETLNSNADVDDLTESTKYESNSSSTTLSTSTTTTEPTTSEVTESLNEDSYFSEGAWLMSKSEGEIMLNANDDDDDNNKKNAHIVNLDMKRAVNSVYLNPHKRVDDGEDGELKLDQINQVNMMLYGGISKGKSDKHATMGLNRIIRQSDLGEVNRGVSEGELETKTTSHSLTKKSKSKSKKKHDQDKTKISLRIEDELSSSSIKNKIKIQPLNITTTKSKSNHLNETLLPNMNDFERRMFSSTPDSSMILNNPKMKRNKTKQVKKTNKFLVRNLIVF